MILYWAAHYGGAVLAGVEDGTVYVKFTGQCASCPSAGDTLESVVKEILMSEIPEIKDVVLDQIGKRRTFGYGQKAFEQRNVVWVTSLFRILTFRKETILSKE